MNQRIAKIISFVDQWKVILVLLLIGTGLFYWYQVRPSRIYSVCHEKAIERAQELLKIKIEIGASGLYKEAAEKELYIKDDYDYQYKQCLRERGINR